ncbi:MAG: hypothetical protein KatS3mg061_1173 [Dehalococcoidia bacterium]|nr:MAG: hypothetical protein KatS3mg061_1173 [Dehalococcoidia bacterium]
MIEGSADLGITGLDTVRETENEGDPLLLVIEDLGYSTCELVLAVPDTWIDVSTIGDLADLAAEFRQRGARPSDRHQVPPADAGFPARTRDQPLCAGRLPGSDGSRAEYRLRRHHRRPHLQRHHPAREPPEDNRGGGRSSGSQACLIANRETLRACPERIAATRKLLELIEARMRGANYLRITANIRGESEQEVASQIWARPELAGLAGPTVSRVYGQGTTGWYAVASRRPALSCCYQRLSISGQLVAAG